MDEPRKDKTALIAAPLQGKGENFGDAEGVTEPGTKDAGDEGQDNDILGKPQADLDADDLKGNARSTNDQ